MVLNIFQEFRFPPLLSIHLDLNYKSENTWRAPGAQNMAKKSWELTGPPRQATGPPRSRAGVGVGMLRVVGIPLRENKVFKQFPPMF